MNFGADTHIKFNKDVMCLLFTVRHFEITLWLELSILSNFCHYFSILWSEYFTLGILPDVTHHHHHVNAGLVVFPVP